MKNFIAFICLLFASEALAQTLVTISDTLKYADGTTMSGTIRISWPSFRTAGGVTILAGHKDVTIASGVVSFTLTPTSGGAASSGGQTPAYTATYRLTSGSTELETWYVPNTAGPFTVGEIRGSASAPQATFNFAQVVGFTPGSIPYATTGGILGQANSTFYRDPTTGYVGIGLSSPTSPFHVLGTSASYPPARFQTNSLTTAHGVVSIEARDIGVGERFNLNFQSKFSDAVGDDLLTTRDTIGSIGAVIYDKTQSGFKGGLALRTNKGASIAERVRILPNGEIAFTHRIPDADAATDCTSGTFFIYASATSAAIRKCVDGVLSDVN